MERNLAKVWLKIYFSHGESKLQSKLPIASNQINSNINICIREYYRCNENILDKKTKDPIKKNRAFQEKKNKKTQPNT